MDQYEDGIAAEEWDAVIGDVEIRLEKYSKLLVEFLRKHGCHHVLDAACGTGVDSIMLLEEGFKVTSSDASDKMLKFALRKRWQRRKEKAFDEWVIEEANWLTLPKDVAKPGEGFDTLICIGNSFACLPDSQADKADLKLAIRNFHEMLKPSGWLIIDHRNYEAVLRSGKWPRNNLYYNGKQFYCKTIERTSSRILRDIYLDVSGNKETGDVDWTALTDERHISDRFKYFRFLDYPHKVGDFTDLLKGVFGEERRHEVYGDYKPLGSVEDPAYFIHFIQK